MRSTSSSRCSTPANVARPGRGSTPRASATAAAAAALARLCGPRSRTSIRSPSCTSAPSRISSGATRRAAPGTSMRRERDVLGTLTREGLELGVAVGLQRAVAVEVVGLEVQQDRRLGRERQRVLELEGGRLADDDGAVQVLAGQRRVRRSRRCRRPGPAPRPRGGSAPSSSTVVVLPFVPVTAIDLGVDEPPGELELAHDRASRAAAPRRRPAPARARRGLHERRGPVELRAGRPSRSTAGMPSGTAGVPASTTSTSSPRAQQRARGRDAGAREADDEVGAARERRSHVIDAW